MPSEPFTEELPLPKAWKQSIKSAVICTLSLALKTITLALAHSSDSDHLPVRMAAQLKRLKMDNAQLKEIIEIKDARMIRLDPKRRPYGFCPVQKAAHFSTGAAIPGTGRSTGWQNSQTSGL